MSPEHDSAQQEASRTFTERIILSAQIAARAVKNVAKVIFRDDYEDPANLPNLRAHDHRGE